jgi:hypothetical protein
MFFPGFGALTIEEAVGRCVEFNSAVCPTSSWGNTKRVYPYSDVFIDAKQVGHVGHDV